MRTSSLWGVNESVVFRIQTTARRFSSKLFKGGRVNKAHQVWWGVFPHFVFLKWWWTTMISPVNTGVSNSILKWLIQHVTCATPHPRSQTVIWLAAYCWRAGCSWKAATHPQRAADLPKAPIKQKKKIILSTIMKQELRRIDKWDKGSQPKSDKNFLLFQ